MKTPTAVWKRIILSGAPVYKRIEALKLLDEDASFSMLDKILANPKTPGKVLSLAGEILVRKIARNQILKESENNGQRQHPKPRADAAHLEQCSDEAHRPTDIEL